METGVAGKYDEGGIARWLGQAIGLTITDMGAGNALQDLNITECMLQTSQTGIIPEMLDKYAGSILISTWPENTCGTVVDGSQPRLVTTALSRKECLIYCAVDLSLYSRCNGSADGARLETHSAGIRRLTGHTEEARRALNQIRCPGQVPTMARF